MLDLRLAAAREVPDISIRGEASRAPEADGRLHTKLVLERAQRGVGVEGPVALGEPVRPSWKSMPMIAFIARRPLASSAFSPLYTI